MTLIAIHKKVEFSVNTYKILKHTRNLLLCGIKIESRTRLYMSYLGVNESEAFLKSVSIFETDDLYQLMMH